MIVDRDRRSIVVFGTDCVLCSRWVHFLLAIERDARLTFVSAWSATGRALAARHGLDPRDLHRTYLVIEDGRPLVHSAASLALLGYLRRPWRWLGAPAILPRPLRDCLYGIVARNRYVWFGPKERCFVPPPSARDRFVRDQSATNRQRMGSPLRGHRENFGLMEGGRSTLTGSQRCRSVAPTRQASVSAKLSADADAEPGAERKVGVARPRRLAEEAARIERVGVREPTRIPVQRVGNDLDQMPARIDASARVTSSVARRRNRE